MAKPIRPCILALAAAVTAALGAAGCATPRQALVLNLSQCARPTISPIVFTLAQTDTEECAEMLGYRPQTRNVSATDIYCRKQEPVAKSEVLPHCFDAQKETRYILARVMRFMREVTPTPPSNAEY